MQRRQKLIFAAFTFAGISLFVAAGLIGNTGSNDISVSQNPAVDAIIPSRGDEVLQQQTVGIDLAAGYRLVRMTISPDEACQFPIDVTSQVRAVDGLQQFLYEPGEGKLIERLSPDDNCVFVTFEEIANPGQTETIDWNFTVN